MIEVYAVGNEEGEAALKPCQATPLVIKTFINLKETTARHSVTTLSFTTE